MNKIFSLLCCGLLVGCATPKFQNISGDAQTASVAIYANIPYETSCLVQTNPSAIPILKNYVSVIETFSLTTTNYLTKYLRATIASVPATNKVQKLCQKVVNHGVDWYWGNPFLFKEDYQYILKHLCDSIESGIELSPKQVKIVYYNYRWDYIIGMIGGSGEGVSQTP